MNTTVEEQTNELLENPNILEGDAFRKSAFDGGSPIYPYGKDGEAVYLNNPELQDEFKEDLFQKHLELNKPKPVEKSPYANVTSYQDAKDIYRANLAEKTKQETAIFGEPDYVNTFNNNQVQVLRKNNISPDAVKTLVENNFFLPFNMETGAISNADKTVGLFTMFDGLYDNFIAFPPNFITGNAMKNSQQRLDAINMAIAGEEDELGWQYGWVKNKSLEELDIMRGMEQSMLEGFAQDKFPTSTEWWQNRIREQGGIEIPITVLEELKKDAGGFATKTTGYAVDFAPIAAGISVSLYKNAIKKYDDFSKWATQFKKTKEFKKGMSEDDLVNAYIKDKYPAMDTTNATKSSWFSRFFNKGQIKTGIDIRNSKEFMKKSKQLSDDITEANKKYQQGLIDFDKGKIDKQKLIRLHDTARDLKFRQLSYEIKGVPKIFKQDAAMELGFAAGAVSVAEMFGDNYEFLGGIMGSVGTGVGGNWVLGVGRTGYHGVASFLDIFSTGLRNGSLGFEADVMRIKPEILRNTKIWDKKLKAYREITWAEFNQFEKFALMLNNGGPDVMKHIQANMDDYNALVEKMETTLGAENIHLLHEQFALISMMGPMMAARDAAKISNTTVTSLFDIANPEFLESLSRHQYMLGAINDVIAQISSKSSRGLVGEQGGVIQQEFKKIQQAVSDFANQNTMDTTKEFEMLLNDSKRFFESIGDVSHPMWDDSELLYNNLEKMDNFFKFVENDPILSTMINKKQYQGMVDDITFYREGVDIINQQITNAIKNVEKSSLPDSRNIEQMSNWLAKSLVMNERLHYKQANVPFKELYKKYKDAEIDGFGLFESFWKFYGKDENNLKSIEVFWRGNKDAPREFKELKVVFDEAAERQIRKLHVLDKTPSYLDSLSPSLKKLEYDKWFKEKQFALAEQLGVKPSTIDSMTMFEWLRSSIRDADGKSLELTFNIQELNKLRGGFQRIEFALSKKGDPSAGTFGSLFDDSEKLITDLSVKYKDVYPNLESELKTARENYKYIYANRYLDKESDIGKIGANWISYSQLGKEFLLGPYTPGGRTFKTHPTKWIDFNKVKKNPELFRDQIAMNIGEYVPGQGYLINPGSEGFLMWQAYATRLIDDSIAKEIRNNSAKFLNGTYRILDGEIVDKSGQAVNTFHDLYRLANQLTFDVKGGGKVSLYNVDRIAMDEQGLIKALNENKNLEKQVKKIQQNLVTKASTDGTVIRKANQQAERAILDQVSKLNAGINDTTNFVEYFIGSSTKSRTGLELNLLGETLVQQGVFKNTDEFNKQVANMVGDYINMTFSNKLGGVSIVNGQSKKALHFDFNGMKGFLDKNEPALLNILDKEHLEFLQASTEMFSRMQGDMFKFGDTMINMMYPGGLTLPAILSRIYGVARGVIGVRFVVSELTLRSIYKGKGNFIKEMLKNKDAARVINEIAERGAIDSKIDKDFNRVLTAAYIETAIVEPESENLSIPDWALGFNPIGLPFTESRFPGDIPLGTIESAIKAPAEFLEGRDVDMSQQEQFQTLFPEGSGSYTKQEHSGAYGGSPVDSQMNNLVP